MRKRLFIKIIAFILINTFLLLDISWATGGEILSFESSDCLSPALQINSNLLTTSFSKLYHHELFPGVEFSPLFERLKKIELAIFDLDETLAISARYLSNPAMEGLKFLLKNKVHTAIITGAGIRAAEARVLNKLKKTLKAEGASWALDYLHIFTCLGNEGFKFKQDGERKQRFKFDLNKDLIDKVREIIDENGDSENIDYSVFGKKGSTGETLVVRVVFDQTQKNKIQKMHKVAEKIRKEFRRQNINLNILESASRAIEITVNGKEYAVGFLMDELSIDAERILIVGDSFGPIGADRSMRFERTLNSLFFNVGPEIKEAELNAGIFTTSFKGPDAAEGILELLRQAKDDVNAKQSLKNKADQENDNVRALKVMGQKRDAITQLLGNLDVSRLKQDILVQLELVGQAI